MMPLRKKIIAAGLIGNFLEAYDLSIFIFMSTFISHYFFAEQNIHNSIIYVFSIFFVGYLARPIGGAVFGVIADRLGRKKALLLSICLMGLTTALVGVVPAHHTISLFILLILRVLQGVSVGGEYINSVTFLLEHADKPQKNFMTSWATAGLNGGFLLASLIAYIVAHQISTQQLPEWAWRLPFFLALLGAGLGYWFRASCPETITFIKNNAVEHDESLATHINRVIKQFNRSKKKMVLIAALTLLGTISTYLTYVYSASHFLLFHDSSEHEAFKVNSLSIALLVALIPLFGYLSDRIGQKILLIISCSVFMLLSYPFFWVISYGNLYEYLFVQLLMTLAAAIFYSIAPIVIVETIPAPVRGSVCAFAYACFASVFGGSAPLVSISLINYTQSPTAPGVYLTACAFTCLVVILLMMSKTPANRNNNYAYQEVSYT